MKRPGVNARIVADPATTTSTTAPAPGDATSSAPASTSAPPTQAVGVSGTTNYLGDIYAESNARLMYQSAYGTAGTREWGEWEELARTNPFVSAGLEFISSPIRDARLDVEEAPEEEEPDREKAKAQADFVRFALNTGEPALPEFLVQATRGMLGTGFALFEPTFRRAPTRLLPGGEGWVLSRLAQRLPSTLAHNAWLENEDGSELRAVKQEGPRGNAWWRGEIPADRLLLFSWQRSGNNYAGFSAFRPVWYLGQIQKELLRLVGVTYQREGAGIPVATASDPSTPLSPEQRRQMLDLLRGALYHEQAAVVMPAGWNMQWVFSGGANKGHVLDAWRQLGIVILQQVQAQQLALGTSDTGSRSVGAVHDASAMAYVHSVIAVLEGVLNGVGSRPYTGLVRRLVSANWGPQRAYPRVKLTPPRAQLAPDARLAAVRDAVTSGVLTVTLDVENATREALGFAPIAEEERDDTGGETAPGLPDAAPGVAGAESVQDTALNGAQVTAAQGIVESVAAGRLPRDTGVRMLVTFFRIPLDVAEALMGDVGRGFEPAAPEQQTVRPAGGAGQEGALSAESLSRAKPQPLTASAPRGPWVPRRLLRASEERTNWGGLDAYFTEAREEFEKEARAVVVAMLAKAAGDITAAMEDGDPSEVATLPLDSKALEELVGQYLDAAREYGRQTATREIEHGTAEEVLEKREDGDNTLRAADPEDEEEDSEATPEERKAIEKSADDVLDAQRRQGVRRIMSRLRLELEEEAIDVLRTGGSAGEVVARTLQRQLDTGAFRSDAGLLTARAVNVGRDEAARIMGGVSMVEYSAVLDSETCSPCQDMDGRQAPFSSAEHDRMLPPNRDCLGGSRCRCVLVFLPDMEVSE